jgi:hypothetical protein
VRGARVVVEHYRIPGDWRASVQAHLEDVCPQVADLLFETTASAPGQEIMDNGDPHCMFSAAW